MKTIKVKTPATAANLGPGFDCLGLAVDLFDELTVHFSKEKKFEDEKVKITGKYCEVPTDETNMVYSLVKQELEENGVFVNFAIECENNIPHSRGLGSSSAAICSALAAAYAIIDEIKGEKFDIAKIYEKAKEIEGHGDNVAPCVFGGIQLITKSEPGHMPLILPQYHGDAFEKVQIYNLISSQPVKTADARAALPNEIDRQLAVQNTASIAELIAAFATFSDPNSHHDLKHSAFGHSPHSLRHHYPRNLNELLYNGTDDHIHQNFRKSVYPQSLEIVEKLRDLKIPAAISGAGSSVIAFWVVEDHENMHCECSEFWWGRSVENRFREFISKIDENWEVRNSNLSCGLSVEK